MSISYRAESSRALRWVVTFALLATGAIFACERPQAEQETAVTLEQLDSLLSELGGIPTATLGRGERWRMISSIGSGLPPTSFKPEDLPEPRSRGAGLLQVYCIQCHWLPTPQMHTAAEWPILMRRMLMRARSLRDRLGGPLTESMVGEILLAGLESAELPSDADGDTLLTYLQKHALPPAQPGEIGPGPGSSAFIEQCAICHELPSPRAHTAEGWRQVVARMRANMSMMDVLPLSDEQTDSIVEYLASRASPGP